MTPTQFKKLALSFPDTEANPHFDRTAYKVTGKRIFATIHEPTKSANLKLPLIEQSTFAAMGKGYVYPINNKWGLQGWTTFELAKVPVAMMKDALTVAYNDVIQTKKKR